MAVQDVLVNEMVDYGIIHDWRICIAEGMNVHESCRGLLQVSRLSKLSYRLLWGS